MDTLPETTSPPFVSRQNTVIRRQISRKLSRTQKTYEGMEEMAEEPETNGNKADGPISDDLELLRSKLEAQAKLDKLQMDMNSSATGGNEAYRAVVGLISRESQLNQQNLQSFYQNMNSKLMSMAEENNRKLNQMTLLEEALREAHGQNLVYQKELEKLTVEINQKGGGGVLEGGSNEIKSQEFEGSPEVLKALLLEKNREVTHLRAQTEKMTSELTALRQAMSNSKVDEFRFNGGRQDAPSSVNFGDGRYSPCVDMGFSGGEELLQLRNMNNMLREESNEQKRQIQELKMQLSRMTSPVYSNQQNYTFNPQKGNVFDEYLSSGNERSHLERIIEELRNSARSDKVLREALLEKNEYLQREIDRHKSPNLNLYMVPMKPQPVSYWVSLENSNQQCFRTIESLPQIFPKQTSIKSPTPTPDITKNQEQTEIPMPQEAPSNEQKEPVSQSQEVTAN